MINNINKKKYIYPKNWDAEDIHKFKYYLKLSKDMYDLPEDVIELCIEREINEQKGLLEPIDHSKIVDIEVDTPPFEEFYT